MYRRWLLKCFSWQEYTENINQFSTFILKLFAFNYNEVLAIREGFKKKKKKVWKFPNFRGGGGF